jgi:hypothetical protein
MVTAFPVLTALGLTDHELTALRQQGFVSRELRAGGRSYAKLRYRFDGRQRAKYLGSNEAFVRQVERELGRLQGNHRLDRLLGCLTREANQVLRSIKPRVEPVLNEQGYEFHGRAVRRPRGHNRECAERRIENGRE